MGVGVVGWVGVGREGGGRVGGGGVGRGGGGGVGGDGVGWVVVGLSFYLHSNSQKLSLWCKKKSLST